MSFRSWWSREINIGHRVTRSLKGTPYEGMTFYELLAARLGKPLENYLKKYTEADITPREQAKIDAESAASDVLAQHAYERDIDYFERFLSPEAQVKHYAAAGLNPALMYEGGASISGSLGAPQGSAGSADAGSAGIGAITSILSSLLQYDSRNKQIETDKMLELRRLDQQDKQLKFMDRYYSALAQGQENNNSKFEELFLLNADEIRSRTGRNWSEADLNDMRISQISQLMDTEVLKQELLDLDISLREKQIVAQGIANAIARAQSKYSEQYFKAVADIQSAQALISQGEAGIFERTLKKREEAAVAELNDIIIRAGIDAKAFETFGKMTHKDWTQLVGKIVGITIGSAAAVGGRAISASARASGGPFVYFPGTMPNTSYSSGPLLY